MCGIVGYTGKQSVAKQILDALELLEYRGYDSAGMAIVDETNGQVQIRKRAGRVADLEKVWKANPVNGICGIGHTRWATHGGVSDVNAHPHRAGRVTLVHNGIIENYEELKDHFGLADELISDTDSEVVAAVLNRFYTGDPHEALFQTVKCLKGTFALVVIFDDIPDVIFAIRNVSPIVAAYREDGTMLASDVAALGGQATSYMVVPEYHVVELHTDDIRVYNMKNELCEAEFLDIDWDTTRAGKGNYPFYMEKEIMEQPEAIKATLAPRYVDGRISLEADGVPDDVLKNCERVCVVACGTAMHAGLVAQSLIRSILRMHMDVEYASEFMYMDPVIDDKTLVLAISQSGETIDTLEALKYARSQGAKSIAVINVKGSSIARESDYVMYTYAGPEIAVASTKAYTTQMAALFALIGRMAVVRGAFNEEQEKAFVDALMQAPDAIQQVLDRKEEMHHIARGLLEAKDAFMLGRGLDYAILLEGALKLKEVSYIHTEAYASGELKHGTIALITEKTPVVALVTQERVRDKELSNIREVQSRGASVVVLVKDGIDLADADYTHVFTLPAMDDVAMAFPASAALQLLAYYVSMDRGLDVDKPRNLAKVVTVE
ncbi:glutamine--fructose-6-phosphate transaminase (isomerizing) [Coprococcus catus]|jgi:glucosamine--fructose-6-phosphate aminotransferase (isomerizing)|uniref:Glutamine--fructose-6-phosphate aminotransferase [isomerizing] n=3 Tax=Coprococcus TaxID=33042 RepID=A0A3E2XJW5_9FIRM|nr:glutamine--fructose-6-phosphate transaminase (isomerizing) [Coprococcus catus]MBD8965205.1 glutamine--fructose-6-phosphate transaminase (isomerizing) [Coprococcus catus]MCI6511763.1 glutamine--fructose-6-phosphate transaminase (isomerizing) [Coprococcus catus]RGC45160.1 glutamine--fructose-6-phosphate transaminase (isomerizing) [Coprococcus catus]CBK80211.1 glutamine--fructose-6-phosphate transaminase [Coprococcus catus GD/7]